MFSKKQRRPIFFLPVESTPRELDYKLNLARHICKLGWDVIIGNPPFIRDELKYKNYSGIFLEKGMNPDPEYYMSLKQIVVYCLSDEGASYPAYSLDYKPSVDSLKQAKKIFLWGEFQKNDLTSRLEDAELNSKYCVIGNPGFDFSKPTFKSYHLSLKENVVHKNYILINTNFGSYNGYTLEETLKACNHCSPSTMEYIKLSYTREKEQFERFRTTIENMLIQFPEELFLLRPHPTEIEEKYIKYFSKYKNITISSKGNVNQAIADAKLIIHNDCTSALQGYLMNVPVISIFNVNSKENINNDKITTQWTFAFGAMPKHDNELISLMSYIINHRSFPLKIKNGITPKSKSVLSKMFDNGGKATIKLLEHLKEDLIQMKTVFKPFLLENNRSLTLKIKCFIRSFMPLHYKVPKASRGSLTKISKKDIVKRIVLLERAQPIRCKFKVKKIFPNTFYINEVDV